MFHYAQLDKYDFVKAVSKVPSEMTGDSIINIDGLTPKERRKLLGKKYNRETGEFEEVE